METDYVLSFILVFFSWRWCIDEPDFRKILMQFDFSAVNENNLNLSRIWLPVKERLLFFRAQ